MSFGRSPGGLSALVGNRGSARDGPGKRRFAGIQIASGCRAVTAALVAASGRGLSAGLEIVATESVVVPDGLVERYRQLAAGEPDSPGEAAQLASLLADVSAELIGRLLEPTRRGAIRASSSSADHSSPSRVDDPLVVSVHDPGLWHVGRDCEPACTGLCDADRLAEKTGLNVVDAFPARDLACGGQGGPLLAMPLWMHLSDARRTRVLLDLGRTVRLTYLPARQGADSRRDGTAQTIPQVLSFDVGPGTVLPDTLAEQFTGGQYAFDPGGTLAVQGHRIGDLIDHWLSDPYFHRPPPRWYPLGVRPDAELQKTVRMAIEAGWTVRDLLCTATHFIAESVARACRTMLPPTPLVSEILLTGGGTHNGFLLSEIAKRLPEIPARLAADVCAGGEALEAAATAALGLLFVDQVPANHPAITGTRSPRVLGRLSAGSPAQWHRLLMHLSDATRSPTLSKAV